MLLKTRYIIILIGLIFMISCKTDNKSGQKEDSGNDIVDVDTTDEFYNDKAKKVTKIFYNVPSPIEMASLMQRAGAIYEPELLNPYENRDKYVNASSRALNLGVYGADLSYTRIFDQLQESMDYLNAIKKLSDGLGIPRGQGSIAINKLEENIDNRDTLLKIISETYANADHYLKQNNRGSTAAQIILGGWIEALYIATKLVDEDNPNKEIMYRIAEQKYSLENLIELISDYKEEDQVLKDFSKALAQLKEGYDKIEIKHSSSKVNTNSDKKVTTIEGKAEITVSMEDIKTIGAIIDSVRTEIVK